VLFLWATVPLIEQGLRIVSAWGFDYKTLLVWDKQIPLALGSWLPIQTEILLVGTKGKMCSPRVEDRMKISTNLISIKKTEHSKKPFEFYSLIEHLYPRLTTRIELYARDPHPGWWAIGDEIPGGIASPPDVTANGQFVAAGARGRRGRPTMRSHESEETAGRD